jgi:hypothetical protein
VDVPGLLALLKAEPTLLPEADPDAAGLDIEQRRQSGVHACLFCGRLATTATLAEYDDGRRWIDLCMPHLVELHRSA